MIQHTRRQPTVSIIIVNFNGQHLLQECLASVKDLEYPKSKIEIILVDNNSSDDSIPFVKRHFPNVKIVANAENLGFTGGNEAGFKIATGEYIVLLNSDVLVDRFWLSSLVSAADDPKIGIISSQLRFAIPFIELTIESKAVPKSAIFPTIDHSPIGILIEEIACETPELSKMVYYKNGFYDRQEGEISTHRTTGLATVLLPFQTQQRSQHYIVTLHGLESFESISTPVKISLNNKVLEELVLKPHQTIQLELEVTKKEAESSFVWLVQNAGNIVLHNGYSKDRGSVVVIRNNEQREFYEETSSYFEKPAELLAACGASCLIKRKVIEQIGFFDGYYFMYYEDIELSLRAWRAGWKIVYEPKSLGYHKHRATTGSEESALFLQFIERNHIALVATHFPLQTFFQELCLFLARTAITFIKFFLFQFQDDDSKAEVWRRKWEGRRNALLYLSNHWFRLIQNRYAVDKHLPNNHTSFQKMLY